MEKNRIAVGPREGNTNGVCETITTADKIAIDTKPMRKTKTAQTHRAEIGAATGSVGCAGSQCAPFVLR
jgi:hypothetical protein